MQPAPLIETLAPGAPRLSIVLPNLHGGGVERVRLLLAAEFIARGYDVELVLMQNIGELAGEVPTAATVHTLGVHRLRGVPLRLSAYLKERKPAAVLSAMWPLTAMTILAAKFSGFQGRIVVSEHNHLSRSTAGRTLERILLKRLGAAAYRAADALVCVSRGVKDDLLSLTGLAAGKASIIYDPVRPERATTATAPEPLIEEWWRKSDFRIVAIGSLKQQKDYPTLLRAMAQLRTACDARLLILGEGKERAAIEKLVAELQLGEAVKLAGFISDPYLYLKMADLFVLSSAWEGLGNVIIEALICGTPVVSTDCPSGPAEILENGRYGRLVPVGDASALAQAMLAALLAPRDPEPLRARGREFSVTRAADQYLALLDPDGMLVAAKAPAPANADIV